MDRKKNEDPPIKTDGWMNTFSDLMNLLLCFVVIGLVQEVLELLAAAGVTELAQRLGFDLADALARDVELLANLFERAGTAVLDAEAQLQDFLLTRGEVLHLFQTEVHLARFSGQLRHVLLRAARVRRDEIWDDLLVQSLFTVDFVEEVAERVEQPERRLAHQLQYTVGGMFRRHFQPARHQRSTDRCG